MFKKAQTPVVVRMAPSPTGHLHIGTARTALFNFCFAKAHNGMFILRSEDTDTERSLTEYETEMNDGLAWLGLTWDAYYRQSERGHIYRTYLEKLIDAGTAYVSKEESKRDAGTEIEVIRLKNPGTTITFDDEVRGEVTFDTTELGDFVIARSLDDALYHFAVVVDDHEMGVTHVIRGEDHISNTPRQILIQEAIGAARPVYAHISLILDNDRAKLSKRKHGEAVWVKSYRENGFLPQAVTNYLAMLGWNPGTDREIFMLDELVSEFDLDGVQKSGAIFNLEKLRWFNREHLLRLGEEAVQDYVLQWLLPEVQDKAQFSHERAMRLVPTIIERIHTGRDIADNAQAGEYDFAFEQPLPDPAMLKWKKDASAKDALPRLRHVAEILSMLNETSDVEIVKNTLMEYADQAGKGEVLWPLRVALTGRERSPDPFTIITIIGTAEAYKRVSQACDRIVSA